MDYTPILAKQVDVSKIKYGPVKKNAAGGKSVYVNYDGNKFALQFPIMHMPYGLTDTSELMKDNKKDSAPKKPNYTMNVSFKGKEDNKAVNNLFTKLQEIEEKIKKDVFANRVTWLNDRYDDMDMVVSKLFSSNLQFDKDKETKKILNRYPPTFRVKVPSVSEISEDGSVETTFKFDCSDMDNNEIAFESIMSKLKGGKAQLIVQLMGLWFAGGKYGCTWKILSGRFQVQRSVKYSYVEDSDDDTPVAAKQVDEDDEEDGMSDDIPAVTSKPPVTVVPESDEEEEEEEEEDDDIPPPPPPPKKVVKKTAGKK
jgi:hypothetical protein